MNREEVSASIQSEFLVLTKDGAEVRNPESNLDSKPIMDFSALRDLISVELMKKESGIELPSIQAMQDMELVDYEPASDKGHFRFYPKGALMFHLLHAWAEEIALNRLRAYPIETPIIYDWAEEDIRNQAESFHENHYIVRVPNDPDKEFILRFAGDFGLFRMMRDSQLTYRHLPVRMYEFAPSFRYEKSGSLSGLRRLRGFWMPDIHSFCLNLEQGLGEYKELFKHYTDLADAMGVRYAVAFRIVGDFYRQHKEEILEMVCYVQQPVLIELLSEMKHYWVMKHEINTIDTQRGTCQTSTVQLDIKDASLYGINYIGADGKTHGCTIVHSSIGSPERWMFSILEDALRKNPPMLPLWLAPVQVRVVPVSERRHLDFCLRVAEQLRAAQIRVDVDDRSNSLPSCVRAAEREWIPFIVVCGDQEVASNCLSIRVRGAGQEKIESTSLIERIKSGTHNMPFRQLPDLLLSKRPVFRGRD